MLGLQQEEKVVGPGRQTNKGSIPGVFPLDITCQCVLGESMVGWAEAFIVKPSGCCCSLWETGDYHGVSGPSLSRLL